MGKNKNKGKGKNKSKGKGSKHAKAKKPTLAQQADRYKLYQKSVQDADHEISFFDKAYRQYFKKAPQILREDFCGTFAVSCAWAAKRGRSAIGIDLDPEPIEWGKKHNLAKLGPKAQQRVTLLEQDVRSVTTPKAHVLAAQNFSFWIFKTRPALREYFEYARKNIAKDGIMVLDMMGGSDCFIENHEDTRQMGKFEYAWEQATHNPITMDATFHIHFRFPDNSELKQAFSYDWRFWSIPEVRELLAEAGFSQTDVFWEGPGKDGDGDGNWKKTAVAEADASWIAYIVALP